MSNDNYKGLVFDKKNRFYVFGDCKLVQIPSGKHIMFDKNIIFCKIVR